MPPQTASPRERTETWILAITPRQDEASGIETRLRDAGQNVRTEWLEAPERLGAALSERRPDLICCRAGEADTDSLKRLLGLCVNAAAGIPVVLRHDADAAERAELIRAGARDVVAPSAVDHLTAVLVRELEVARLREDCRQQRIRADRIAERMDSLLAESPDARALIREGIHAELNPIYASLFGFESPEELEGVPLMDLVVPADRDRVKKKLSDCRKGKAAGEPIRFTGQRADDSPCNIQMYCRMVQLDGEDAVELLIPQSKPQGSGRDDDARTALYHALEQPPTADQHAVEGLYVVAIDDMPGLQARIGLAAAERIADELALFLLNEIGEHDHGYRFNASEFVVFSGREYVEELRKEADRLRAAIDDEVFGDEEVSTSLTATVAVAVAGDEGDREQLFLSALQRARETSAKGGNTVVMEAKSAQRGSNEVIERDWLHQLQQALQHNRFTFAYQSIASLEGDDSEHFDVLLRMPGEHGELRKPEEFAAIAHRHGLTVEVDRQAVEKLIDLVEQRRRRGVHGMFFFRLSDASLAEAPRFLEWLHEVLSGRGIRPEEIRFSLTEESLRSNVRRAQQLAEGLGKLGLSLAIDRFGSTGKSVQLLERVRADFAKLDAAVTEALAGEDNDPTVVAAVETARERGVRLVAQQVADANTMARLWQLGINFVQGAEVQEPDLEAERNSHVA